MPTAQQIKPTTEPCRCCQLKRSRGQRSLRAAGMRRPNSAGLRFSRRREVHPEKGRHEPMTLAAAIIAASSAAQSARAAATLAGCAAADQLQRGPTSGNVPLQRAAPTIRPKTGGRRASAPAAAKVEGQPSELPVVRSPPSASSASSKGRPGLDALAVAAKARENAKTMDSWAPVDFFDVVDGASWGLPRPRPKNDLVDGGLPVCPLAALAAEKEVPSPLRNETPASRERCATPKVSVADKPAPSLAVSPPAPLPGASVPLPAGAAATGVRPASASTVRRGFGSCFRRLGGPAFLCVIPEDLLVQALCGNLVAESLASLGQSSRKMKAVAKVVALQRLLELHATELQEDNAATQLRGPRCPLHRLFLRERTGALLLSTMAVLWQPLILASGKQQRRLQLSGTEQLTQLFECNSRSSEPLLLSPESLPVRITAVCCGKDHLLLLDAVGHAWAMGDPSAAGVATYSDEELQSPRLLPKPPLTRPTPLHVMWGVHLAKVSCGNGHNIAMSREGDIYVWGRALDQDTSQTLHRRPCKVTFPVLACDVAAGDSHVAAVCWTGAVYLWGENHHGQCARDPQGGGTSAQEHLVRAPARALGELQSVQGWRVACGRYHTAVLSSSGHGFTFGDGLSGQLGRRPEAHREGWRPTQVTFPNDLPSSLLVQVACGDDHTLCLTELGQVLAFGGGEQGQLCMGGCRSHRSPVLVRQIHGVREVVAGGHWTLLRCSDGKVFLAGRPGLREGRSEDEEARVVTDHRLMRQIIDPWAM
eukprot:s996_g32.t1